MRLETPSEIESAPPLHQGRFHLYEVLGTGGMATVYRAYDSKLRVARAIKILSPTLWERPKVRARFEDEGQMMARLDHRNIVRILDSLVDGNRAFIVMELVEGGCLTDWLEAHGPLPQRKAMEIVVDVLTALDAAHAQGIIHRDIKPHNVLVTASGEIRVTDFGIARILETEDDHLTKTGVVMGTWAFMPPEQRNDAKSADATADVYSVGATLFSLLRAETPKDLFASDLDPSLLNGIPEAIVPFLKRATRYHREDRFQTAAAMRHAALELIPTLPPIPADMPPLAVALSKRKPSNSLHPVSKEPAAAAGGAGEFGTLAPAETAFSSLGDPDGTEATEAIRRRKEAPTKLGPQKSLGAQSMSPQSMSPQSMSPQSTPPQTIPNPSISPHPSAAGEPTLGAPSTEPPVLGAITGMSQLGVTANLEPPPPRRSAYWLVGGAVVFGGVVLAATGLAFVATTWRHGGETTPATAVAAAPADVPPDPVEVIPPPTAPVEVDVEVDEKTTPPDATGSDESADLAVAAPTAASTRPTPTDVPATDAPATGTPATEAPAIAAPATGTAVTDPPAEAVAEPPTVAVITPPGPKAKPAHTKTPVATQPSKTAEPTSAPEPAAVKPSIQHGVITSTTLGTTIKVTAQLVGSPDLDQLHLRYRKPKGLWLSKPMFLSGGIYSATLEVTPEFKDGIEYFLDATSTRPDVSPVRHGSPFQPHQIEVR